jgi:archaellum component FlaC
MRPMSEDRTRELPDSTRFEQRLFARLDAMEARFEARFRAIDARFDAVDERLNGLDNRVQALEAKALDTKPIWENALTEIFAVKQSIEAVKQRVEEVKQSVEDVKGRVENIESKFDILIIDMMQLRGDQRGIGKRMEALESASQ